MFAGASKIDEESRNLAGRPHGRVTNRGGAGEADLPRSRSQAHDILPVPPPPLVPTQAPMTAYRCRGTSSSSSHPINGGHPWSCPAPLAADNDDANVHKHVGRDWDDSAKSSSGLQRRLLEGSRRRSSESKQNLHTRLRDGQTRTLLSPQSLLTIFVSKL